MIPIPDTLGQSHLTQFISMQVTRSTRGRENNSPNLNKEVPEILKGDLKTEL